MQNIFVKIFGIPHVSINNLNISFPFKQAEALFYYLFVNRKATREELMNLLWPDEEEATARKNLRNALYVIKKTFTPISVISAHKDIVNLKDESNIQSDLDEDKLLASYSGDWTKEEWEFLKGLSIKQGENFEQWVLNQREFYREKHIEQINALIIKHSSMKESEKVECYAKLLIELDEFNEEAYRILMRLYKDKGNYNNAVGVYNKLKVKLDRELGVSPDYVTEELKNSIIYTRSSKTNEESKKSGFFFGRHKELERVQENFACFLEAQHYKNIIIMGEPGIGKSCLKDRFLASIEDNKLNIIDIHCFQAEDKYILKPWSSILSIVNSFLDKQMIETPSIWTTILTHIFPHLRMDGKDLDIRLTENQDFWTLQVIEETIQEILIKVSENKKLIIAIEDLQWADDYSHMLLKNIVLNGRCTNIFFILTCREFESSNLEETILSLVNYEKLERLFLNRFSKEETFQFIQRSLAAQELDNELKNKIYIETEGNAFFMIEFLNSLKEGNVLGLNTSKMHDILKSRLFGISEEGKKLLNICSIFFHDTPLELLMRVSGKDEMFLLDVLDELQNRNLIKEIYSDGEACFRFTHQKLREFVYNQMSISRRKLLHLKAALAFEVMLIKYGNSYELYSKLIYHYESADDHVNKLKYSIKIVNSYVDYLHELFPTTYSLKDESSQYALMKDDEVNGQLIELKKLLNKVKREEKNKKESLILEMDFLHLRGRFFIRGGNYEDGVGDILRLIKLSLNLKQYEFTLKAYRQIIYYCIQISEVEEMEQYIDKALDLSESTNNMSEKGILLRLKALSKMMRHEYDEAENLLVLSIDIFTKMDMEEGEYLVSVAAAYNYMGDIRKNRKAYEEALNYYRKAISICEDKRVLTGLALFKTNAGVAYYSLGHFHKASRYIYEALELYNKCDGCWGRAVAEAYGALIQLREKKYDAVLKHIKSSDYYANRLKSPEQINIVRKIKDEVSQYIDIV